MQFNPRWTFYIGIATTIEIAVSHGTLSLTHAIPDAWIPAATAWAGILAFIGSTVMTFMSAYASSREAPVVSVAPTVKLVAAFIALAALALIGAGSASAQNVAPRAAPRLTGNPIADIKAAASKSAEEPQLTGDPVSDLHAVIAKVGQKYILHLKQQYALAAAPGADGAPNDPISAACAKGLVPIIDLVVNGPKAGAIAAPDPMAFTPDEAAMAADPSATEGLPVKIEKVRILRRALQSDALNQACGPLVQDEVKQAKNLIGGITSLITGAGLLGIP